MIEDKCLQYLEMFFSLHQINQQRINSEMAILIFQPYQNSLFLQNTIAYRIFSFRIQFRSPKNIIMGACNCDTTKNTRDQISHEVDTHMEDNQRVDYEPSNHSNDNRIPGKEGNDKRRGKNALIIANDLNQMQDNVEYDEQTAINPNDVIQIKKALKKHFIFSQLSQSQINYFIKEMKCCSSSRDTYIFNQGDKSGSYYIILEGVCQVEINGEKKRTLTYGDSFGDLGIIYSAPRSASVKSLTDCELVQINRRIFKKVMEDINQLHQKQNKKFLKVLSFFKDLTEQQKNALASTCLTQTYEQGQVIFNQGDDANSFYIIKEGIVNISEKDHELRQMDCFGQNSILVEGGVRSNTLVAKSHCKIISMSRQNIRTSLGDSLKNVIKKNYLWNIIIESKLNEQLDVVKLKESSDNCQFIPFKKGETVFSKDSEHKGTIYVLLNTDLKGAANKYQSNSVIELDEILMKKGIVFKEDFIASDDGMIGKLSYEFEVALPPITIKLNQSVNKDLEKKMVMADFHVVRRLRQGNFGKVYACWNTKLLKMYAIKVLDRSYIQKSQIIQYILNQEQILRTIPKSPFIINFYKLIKDSNFIYFIMDLIEGQDLFDVITKVQRFTPEYTRFLVSQILIMMEHMHSNKVIYRDLKPQNIMMNSNGYLTLVDMGTAKKLKIQRRFKTATIIGTPHYMAPEIITGKEYSFPVDLWSLGTIAYELICGKLPFGQNTDDPFAIYQEITHSSVKYPRSCSRSSKAFIEQLLSRSPHQRTGGGYDEMKKHLFFDGLDWKKIMSRTYEPLYKPADKCRIFKSDIQKALQKQGNKAATRFLLEKSYI